MNLTTKVYTIFDWIVDIKFNYMTSRVDETF